MSDKVIAASAVIREWVLTAVIVFWLSWLTLDFLELKNDFTRKATGIEFVIDSIQEIKTDIKSVKDDIGTLKTDVALLKKE